METGDYAEAAGVSCVVMESTGQYWKPFYYGMEGARFEQVLATPAVPSPPAANLALVDSGAGG